MYLLHMNEGVDTHMLHMTEVFKWAALQIKKKGREKIKRLCDK